MNIGIFTDTYYPEVNGVAHSVYQLKQGLERRGHTVYIFTVSNPDMENIIEDNVIRIVSLPFLFLKERRVAAPIARAWRRKIESFHLDIIHTQTEFGMGHLGRKAAEYLGVPHVHTYHTIYEDYTHYLKVPGNEKLKGLVRSFTRHCCEHADAVIVPTEKVRTLLDTYQIQTPKCVIPTGINLTKFMQPDMTKVADLKLQYHLENKHVLVYIGRISKEKNLLEVLEMFEKASQIDAKAVLLIAGDGPEAEVLKEWCMTHMMNEKIIFTGMVPWENIQNYYALGDIFVSASNSETQGLTYAEALAAGVPLLVRADECLESVLQEKVNGVAFENESEFIDGYTWLMKHMHGKVINTDTYISVGHIQKNEVIDRADVRLKIRDSIRFLSGNAFAANVEDVYSKMIWSNRLYEKTIRMAGQA